MRRTIAALVTFAALVVACGPGLYHESWAHAEQVCGPASMGRCEDRCDPALAFQTCDCQVRLVRWAERADLSKEDPAELAALATSLTAACVEGLERACKVRARLQGEASARTAEVKTKEEIERRAWAAVELDGDTKGKEVASRLATVCAVAWNRVEGRRDFGPACAATGKGLMGESSTAVNAGWALAMASVSTWRAERFLVEAEAIARKRDAARQAKAEDAAAVKKEREEEAAQRKRADDAERDRFQAYSVECYGNGDVSGKSRKPCDQKCESGDAPACVASAVMLLRGKNSDLDAVMGAPSRSTTFSDGRALLKKTCDAGSRLACAWLGLADEALAGAEKRARGAWDHVEDVGDDLVQRKARYAFGQQHFGPRAAPGLARMAQDIASTTRDDFCPVVRDFVKAIGRAEYMKRAKDHCDNHPPTGSGVGGEEVELKNECRAVFATACGP
jgi:hypothetical protein